MSGKLLFILMRVAVIFWILVANGMLAVSYDRKKFFLLRWMFSLFAALGLSVAIGIGGYNLLHLFGTSAREGFIFPLINLGSHFLLCLLGFLHLFVCYREKSSVIVYAGIASYSIQNVGTLVTNIVGIINPSLKFLTFGSAVTVQSFVAWLLSYVCVYLLVWLVFGKSIRLAKETAALNSKTTIVLSAVIVFVALIARSIGSSYHSESPLLFILLSLCDIACCVLVLYIQFLLTKEMLGRKEKEAILHMQELRLAQYEMTKEHIEIINLKCHDLKHQLLALRKSGEIDRDYLDQLADSVNIYDSMIKTGNASLDVVITDKNLYCKQNDVKMTVMADGEKLSFLSDSEIYSLFGNALDNAIEYVVKLPPEKRIVKLSVSAQGNMVAVSVRNYFEGELKLTESGLPQTTKEKSGYHGYGIRSIQKIAERHGGLFSVKAENNQFVLGILFPAKR